MRINFSEYINDIARILILLNSVKNKKTHKMTENRIKLYDYYLKFPHTMIKEYSERKGFEMNFDEYYAFFHWQPDLICYRQSLNYLIAKKFVIRRDESNMSIYTITDLGVEALANIENSYKNQLIELTNDFIPMVVKLSDAKIDEIIREKSNIFLRNGGMRNED